MKIIITGNNHDERSTITNHKQLLMGHNIMVEDDSGIVNNVRSIRMEILPDDIVIVELEQFIFSDNGNMLPLTRTTRHAVRELSIETIDQFYENGNNSFEEFIRNHEMDIKIADLEKFPDSICQIDLK